MGEKADLREANLNGAILADAKLGGAPRRGILASSEGKWTPAAISKVAK
jgi:uncharacterized protein YjbI with pentapeptide repeats